MEDESLSPATSSPVFVALTFHRCATGPRPGQPSECICLSEWVHQCMMCADLPPTFACAVCFGEFRLSGDVRGTGHPTTQRAIPSTQSKTARPARRARGVRTRRLRQVPGLEVHVLFPALRAPEGTRPAAEPTAPYTHVCFC